MLSEREWAPLRLDELSQEIVYLALQTLPPDKEVHVEITSSSEQVSPKQASGMALVINEMMTNVIKHALQGNRTVQVKITISPAAKEVLYEFRDSGPGYPKPVLDSTQNNTGLYLIHNIVQRDLGGQVIFYNNDGAVIAIRLKASRETGTLLTREETSRVTSANYGS
jgi:two-component sensor histidine kinase